MKSRFFLIILIHICTICYSFSQSDTLYVYAPKGLNLRKTPDPDGIKIQTIPYLAQVIYLHSDPKDEIAYQTEEVKGYFVKGKWIKVKYKLSEGYIFNGYLMKYKPYLIDDNNGLAASFRTEEEFVLTRLFGKSESYQILKKAKDCVPNKDYNCVCEYYRMFRNSVKFYYYGGCSEEGGISQKIYLPGFSFREAYLFTLFFNRTQPNKIVFDKEKKTISIGPDDDGAGCYYDISEQPGGAMIEGGCGC